MKKKSVLALASALIMSLSLCACSPENKPPVGGDDTVKPTGLTVKNAQLMKDNKPFYGAGVNFYDMFTNGFHRKWDLQRSYDALEVLKEYDCKVIRFSTLPFYEVDMGYYTEAEETYWSKLDTLIKKCEELEIGLIPSMFWTFSCFDYYNEPYHDAINNPESQGMQFIKDYTLKFVNRYKESPAIWGWEFSNEKVLSSDLIGKESANDYFTCDDLKTVYSFWAQIVYDNDPYKRVISTGDTNPRMTQYNQWKYGSYKTDSSEEHEEVMKTINPGKINTVTQHQYSSGAYDPQDATAPLFGNNTWKKFFQYLIDMSTQLDKACYVGEVGYTCNKTFDWSNVTKQNLQDCYSAVKEAVLETNMQLVLFWNYDPKTVQQTEQVYFQGNGIEYSWNENTEWGKIALQTMKEINAEYANK